MTELPAGEVLVVPDAVTSPAAARPDEGGLLTTSALPDRLYEGDVVTADGRLDLRVYVAIIQRRVLHEIEQYRRQGLEYDLRDLLREQMKFLNPVVELLMETRGKRR